MVKCMARFQKSFILKSLSIMLLCAIAGWHALRFVGQRHAWHVSAQIQGNEMARLSRQREEYIVSLLNDERIRKQEEQAFSGPLLPGADAEKLPDVIGRLPVERSPAAIFDEREQRGESRQKDELPPFDFQKQKSFSVPSKAFQFPRPGYDASREIAGHGFPPVGEPGASYEASIYYPLQKRFAPVVVKSVFAEAGLVLYGAALCEEIQGDSVVLAPCVFREALRMTGPEGGVALFSELAKGVQYTQTLAFFPWSRYATSHMGCAAGGQYRITVQFGDKPAERFVSLRVPYSSSKEDALLDLNNAAGRPCMGLDLFFAPESVMRILRDIRDRYDLSFPESRETTEEIE